MYTEFISKNLREFHKISDTIQSCKNELHFQTTQSLCENFGYMCDNRDNTLKKLWLKNIFNINRYNQWRQYHNTAKEQVDGIVFMMNNWAEQYKSWVDSQKEDKPKVSICGFADLSQMYEYRED